MRSIGILIIVFGVLSACSSDAVVEYLVRDTVGCVTGNGCLAVDVATNVVEYAHDQMKSDTLYSNTSKSTTSSRYCKRNDDSVYGSKFCSVSHTQITKAEYNRLKGKTVTASKSTTPSSKATYCKRRDGTVYIHRSNSSRSLRDCHVAITKAEYDRLTGKTTVTASKSTTKLGYLHCKRSDGTVYRTERDVCGISGGRISKTEYDRLKGKKTVSKYIKNFKNTFCKGNSGAVYSSVRQCGAGHKEITKAEHDRLARGGTVTASKSSTSSGKTVYCRSPSGNVYRSNREDCRTYTQTTKAEYDRQKNKAADTASTSTTSPSKPIYSKPVYCKTADGAAYKNSSPYAGCGAFNEKITKAEYVRIQNQGPITFCRDSLGGGKVYYTTINNCPERSKKITIHLDSKNKKTVTASHSKKPSFTAGNKQKSTSLENQNSLNAIQEVK